MLGVLGVPANSVYTSQRMHQKLNVDWLTFPRTNLIFRPQVAHCVNAHVHINGKNEFCDPWHQNALNLSDLKLTSITSQRSTPGRSGLAMTDCSVRIAMWAVVFIVKTTAIYLGTGCVHLPAVQVNSAFYPP